MKKTAKNTPENTTEEKIFNTILRSTAQLIKCMDIQNRVFCVVEQQIKTHKTVFLGIKNGPVRLQNVFCHYIVPCEASQGHVKSGFLRSRGLLFFLAKTKNALRPSQDALRPPKTPYGPPKKGLIGRAVASGAVLCVRAFSGRAMASGAVLCVRAFRGRAVASWAVLWLHGPSVAVLWLHGPSVASGAVLWRQGPSGAVLWRQGLQWPCYGVRAFSGRAMASWAFSGRAMA